MSWDELPEESFEIVEHDEVMITDRKVVENAPPPVATSTNNTEKDVEVFSDKMKNDILGKPFMKFLVKWRTDVFRDCKNPGQEKEIYQRNPDLFACLDLYDIKTRSEFTSKIVKMLPGVKNVQITTFLKNVVRRNGL